MKILLALLLFCNVAHAQDPLASWNDGPAKSSIIEFITATTDSSNPNFVPEDSRIATFDQDGTLWVEKPIYTQVFYCLDRLKSMIAQTPALKDQEPYKSVINKDLASLTMQDLEKIAEVTLTGMSTEQFQAEVAAWIKTAKDKRWG